MAEHKNLHTDLEKTLDQDILLEWGHQVQAWEHDRSNPNPFEHTRKGMNPTLCFIDFQLINVTSGPSLAAVRRQLAEEEAQKKSFSLDEVVTPSVLISSGMELENQQWVFLCFVTSILFHVFFGQTIIKTRTRWSLGARAGSPAYTCATP